MEFCGLFLLARLLGIIPPYSGLQSSHRGAVWTASLSHRPPVLKSPLCFCKATWHKHVTVWSRHAPHFIWAPCKPGSTRWAWFFSELRLLRLRLGRLLSVEGLSRRHVLPGWCPPSDNLCVGLSPTAVPFSSLLIGCLETRIKYRPTLSKLSILSIQRLSVFSFMLYPPPPPPFLPASLSPSL